MLERLWERCRPPRGFGRTRRIRRTNRGRIIRNSSTRQTADSAGLAEGLRKRIVDRLSRSWWRDVTAACLDGHDQSVASFPNARQTYAL